MNACICNHLHNLGFINPIYCYLCSDEDLIMTSAFPQIEIRCHVLTAALTGSTTLKGRTLKSSRVEFLRMAIWIEKWAVQAVIYPLFLRVYFMHQVATLVRPRATHNCSLATRHHMLECTGISGAQRTNHEINPDGSMFQYKTVSGLNSSERDVTLSFAVRTNYR